MSAYNQHYTETTPNQDIPLYAMESKHRIAESSGLNPLYDLKLQGE